MKYNTSGQRFICVAIDSDGFVTGEAANITGTISIDGDTPAATSDTNPTELGYGRYAFDLTQAETAGHELVFVLTCSTSGVMVTGEPSDVIYTTREDEVRTKTELITAGGFTVTRLSATTIYLFVGETHNYTLSTDDYTAKTLQLIFETNEGVDVATIADGSITKATTSITFAVPAAVTASQRILRWSLRDTASGDEVLAYGAARIDTTALSD